MQSSLLRLKICEIIEPTCLSVRTACSWLRPRRQTSFTNRTMSPFLICFVRPSTPSGCRLVTYTGISPRWEATPPATDMPRDSPADFVTVTTWNREKNAQRWAQIAYVFIAAHTNHSDISQVSLSLSFSLHLITTKSDGAYDGAWLELPVEKVPALTQYRKKRWWEGREGAIRQR